MYRRSNNEWEHLYRTVWRLPFAGLSKELRAKLVRGCHGKDCYSSPEEAEPIIAQMPLRPPLFLRAYKCPLCKSDDGRPVYHIGNSRNPNTLPERLIVPNKTVDNFMEP